MKTNKEDENALRLDTERLQSLLDENRGKEIHISAGQYLTGPLFVRSGTHLFLDEGVILLASTDENNYPLIHTRVAGVEMDWYPAILNVIGEENVIIEGKGTIDGNGPYWWNKFFGEDRKGGYMAEYSKMGLRPLADYECKRPRNILISNSHSVLLKGLNSSRPGFWHIHVLNSNDIKLIDLHIDSGQTFGPSSDGIDVDSSFNVLIDGCYLNTHDDDIVLKSGRGAKANRNNSPTHDVTISNCHIEKGYGIAIGSELSAGVKDIHIHGIDFVGSSVGLRIKSSPDRKGFVSNIDASNIKMRNVAYAFRFESLWNPAYSVLKKTDNDIFEKQYVKDLLEEFPSGTGNTKVESLSFSNFTIGYDDSYMGVSRLFDISWFSDSPIKGISIDNLNSKTKEYGRIINSEMPTLSDSTISFDIDNDDTNNDFDNE